jgi:Fur family ferric uptake transcriptional regulator
LKKLYDVDDNTVTSNQRDVIIQKLKDKGCRVTRQRLLLLDIILENECSCCKEIYYKAQRQGANIGTATVYRMVNTLEEIGAISRKNMYRVDCEEDCEMTDVCMVEFDDGTVMELSQEEWKQIVSTGLKECGYMKNRKPQMVKCEMTCPFSA